VRYPIRVQILDESFAKYRIFNAAVERLATGSAGEARCGSGTGATCCGATSPTSRIMRWDEETGVVGVFRKPSKPFERQHPRSPGRLVTCEHDSRRVTRTEYEDVTVLMDRFENKPLNSPNDVVVKSDDSVWFTDPPFGILGNYEGHVAPVELPTNVYRLDRRPATTRGPATSRGPTASALARRRGRLYVVVSGAMPREISV